MNERIARVTRKTSETDISIKINLDGSGKANINTNIGFFDHMLNALARHALIDLEIEAIGDLEVDSHHLIEDVGIVLGDAIDKALKDKKSINRYGYFILPMDEALVLTSIDLSKRPYFVFDLSFKSDKLGELDTQMIREFFYAISYSAKMNLHIKQMSGINDHHIAEAAFKSFAKSLHQAIMINEKIDGVLSTKGSI